MKSHRKILQLGKFGDGGEPSIVPEEALEEANATKTTSPKDSDVSNCLASRKRVTLLLTCLREQQEAARSEPDYCQEL
jgi:hypothetical protein